MANWSVPTVGFPEPNPPCARDYARSKPHSRTPRLRLSYFPPYQPVRRVAPLDADAAARWQARNTRRGAARRGELAGAHFAFHRAQTAMRSRSCPLHTYPKDATSSFELLSSVPADASSRPTRRRRGRSMAGAQHTPRRRSAWRTGRCSPLVSPSPTRRAFTAMPPTRRTQGRHLYV